MESPEGLVVRAFDVVVRARVYEQHAPEQGLRRLKSSSLDYTSKEMLQTSSWV